MGEEVDLRSERAYRLEIEGMSLIKKDCNSHNMEKKKRF